MVVFGLVHSEIALKEEKRRDFSFREKIVVISLTYRSRGC
jgi:hypothetical protein